ncbi:MAG: bis(5'-nucleosyl)-tetraphosphatase (symmetrical) YqeK [Spirochaetales bacterium]|nr:bis(5'-nucleosyl)-tetraphosphatase (symmetrical) YqeK [Spirochaetales bacterium]
MKCRKAYDKVVKSYVRHLSKKRERHSMAVAELAGSLCRKFGLKRSHGVLAGAAHDIARELPVSDIIQIAERDRLPVQPYERDNPVLLHGRAAAVILFDEFGIDVEEILEAVRDHSLGSPGMGPLARIVFIADFLEPGRKYLVKSDTDIMLSDDLDVMLLHVVERLVKFYSDDGMPLLMPTIELLEELVKKVKLNETKR